MNSQNQSIVIMESIKTENKKRLYVTTENISVRMFDNPILDFFSRVHWSTPLIVFVPVVLYFSYYSIISLEVSIGLKLLLALCGVFVWTFFEYFLHRFVFHYHPTGELAKRIHFIAHGVHHDYPQDETRLVMPPGVSIPLALSLYFVFKVVLGPIYIAPFFAAFVASYLFYDMMHYASHHAHFKNPYFKMIKQYHMDHHYVDDDLGFGFTSKFWDYVFNTTFKKK